MVKVVHFVLSVACLAGITAAVAQTQQRDEAVITCVGKAQREVPMRGDEDPNDPQYSRRSNIYATCMKELNQNP
jgi:hypothetical protein